MTLLRRKGLVLGVQMFCNVPFSRIVDTNWGQDPSQLPTRYLPPGNLKLLHAQCGFNVSFLARSNPHLANQKSWYWYTLCAMHCLGMGTLPDATRQSGAIYCASHVRLDSPSAMTVWLTKLHSKRALKLCSNGEGAILALLRT